ncbi:hypothetical protein JQC91_12750 [Jannaschia sp. Os4]|uniref:hypothetical protein n=1 Tax=Jannaschia sp. Os4 TaxID=2807617 RepID=UPI0019399DC6|nr:hypothetical protein [Jannaschia sp. Os4]MBM2577169.1 hypothetical protein [Jannaschia sp. Os4]
MNRTLAALTTAATLALAPAAFADGHLAGSMGEGFDMLSAALADDFQRLGIEMDTDGMDALTLGELAAIKNIIESQDGDNQKKGQIEAILAD